MSIFDQQTQNRTTTQQQSVDPRIGQYMFGGENTAGYLPAANQWFQNGPTPYYPGQTYAGMNDTQRQALAGQMEFLNSPQAMQGYNGMNQAMQGLLAAGGATQNSAMSNFQAPGAAFQSAGPAVMTGPAAQAAAGPGAAAGSAGGPNVNHNQALERALSGQVDNPQLAQMSQDIARLTTDNFLTQVAPQLRGSAQQAGGFGGSRQGIVEGLATQGLNRDLAAQQNALYGNAYEAAQNRMSQTGMALDSNRTQAEVANANAATQASIANAQVESARLLANAQMQNQMGMFNAGQANDMSRFNAGQANQMGQFNAGMQLDTNRLNSGNYYQGQGQAASAFANAANVGERLNNVPNQNFQQMFNAGSTLQTDAQNQIGADMARWQYESNAPYQHISNYANIINPAAGYNMTSTQTEPMYRNPLAGAAGGALTGAGVGASFGPWGAVLGGLAGGALGYYGS